MLSVVALGVRTETPSPPWAGGSFLRQGRWLRDGENHALDPTARAQLCQVSEPTSPSPDGLPLQRAGDKAITEDARQQDPATVFSRRDEGRLHVHPPPPSSGPGAKGRPRWAGKAGKGVIILVAPSPTGALRLLRSTGSLGPLLGTDFLC